MNTLYIKLSSILEQFLRDRQPRIEPSPSNTYPLFLLLFAKPDLVGFALLDSQPEENFSKAFQNFKDLYSIHSSEWADFDLTLVFCKTDTEKIPDEFCNEIEIDPYFCRKFVIDLSKNLNTELGRLPFIPLHPESIVGLKRPITAQTFLMKHGVNSDLARYLVVPHAKGIERIVVECIKGILGKPTWFNAEIEKFLLSQYEVSPKVRLKELEISNFRAFRNYKFDLDADLVILFGPNGFGKTSFFDAIDFACTGGVARFDKRFGRKRDRLLNALMHLDSSKDDSFVKMTTLIDGEEVPLERYMKDRTQAFISGVPKDRTKTLMELTRILEEPPDLRIENLVRLFRATHLFGQEYQSLTSGFRDNSNSRLPEDTVSRMLALQDYVESINKTRKISEELRKRIREKESEVTFLNISLKSKKAEMEQLSRSARIIEKPETILAMGKKIAEKVVREVDISIEISTEVNQEMVRSWRGMIEAQLGAITQNLEVNRQLEAIFPDTPIHRKKLKEKTVELNQKKKLLLQLKEDYFERKKNLEESVKKHKKMLLEEKNLYLKRENLNWLLKTKVEYEQLKEQIVKENKDYQNVQAQLLELLPKIEKMKSENKAAEENAGKITSEIKVLEIRFRKLTDFEKSIDDWLKTARFQNELELYLQKSEQQLVNMKNEVLIKKGGLNAAIVAQDKLRKHIDNLQQSQSELQTLLDKIERHILNNICPVCGTPHKSQEELIERLKLQRGIQPKQIQEALKLFEDATVKTDELKRQVSDLELKIKQSEQKYREIQKEIAYIKEKIKTYEETAISLDIPTISENLAIIIDSQKKELTNKINTKQQELSKQKSKAQKQREELTSFINKQKDLEQNSRTIESKLSQLHSMVEKIRGDALTRQVSLELEKEVIQNDLTIANNTIESLRKQIEIQQIEYQNIQNETNYLLEKRNILEREIQELDREILNSKKSIEEVESLVKRLNLRLDIELDQILLLKNGLVEKLSRLESLRNEVTDFEIALDAVQISAALAKIRQEIENITKQLQNIEKERNQLGNWLSYFDNICKELESVQNRSLKEYTEKYGPLTSTIQRRLRPVYGFGEMELVPEKGGIAVRVERKGQKGIFLSDYFSESQIQIVMLSLFLSAALTQTWSSFAPILFDDPVTHFDDLNAYSLLDLIRGLIVKSGKGRQFIISTCEDRLFRLMRQKFNKLDGKAIFYVFESIGEKGPKIKRL